MKKIIMLLIVLFGMTGVSIYGMGNSFMAENVTNLELTSKDYTGWLTVSSPITIIHEDESTVTVTNNEVTVDFDLEITILGFFTGTVQIKNVDTSGTNIMPGTTSSVIIGGKEYTVTFNSGTITDAVCTLDLTVKSTPLGDLHITFE